MMTSQKQSGGAHSTNVQAQILNLGLSYEDVRAIVRDEVRPVFAEMSDRAAEVATERAIEVAEALIDRLIAERPEALEAATDPDFQHALITAQREYARSGDPELRDLLIDVLVDRANYEGGGFIQTVLNESLSVAPKLTADQLAGLTAMFLGSRVRSTSAQDVAQLVDWARSNFEPLIDRLPEGKAWFGHLQYTGCVQSTIIATPRSFASSLSKAHPGAFQKGLTDEQVLSLEGLSLAASEILIPCLRDKSHPQFPSLNVETLDHALIGKGVEDPEVRSKIKDEYFTSQLIDAAAVKAEVAVLWPRFAIVENWINGVGGFQLTSIGIAIAHTNWTRLTGNRVDLSQWIN